MSEKSFDEKNVQRKQLRQKIKEQFDLFDKQNLGKIKAKDLNNLMQKLELKPKIEELETMINEVDIDQVGYIYFEDFMKIYEKYTKNINIYNQLKQAFQIFDRDSSGTLSIKELREQLLELGEDVEDLEFFFQQLDQDGDGQIDFEEFINMILYS